MLMEYSSELSREGYPVKANPKAMLDGIQNVFCQLLVWVMSKQHVLLAQTRLKG